MNTSSAESTAIVLLKDTMNDWTQFEKKQYFDFNSAAAFAGPKKLKTVLKQNGYNVSLNEV